jgi:Arc/MetJ-type ribon-helix-helix transcriptional regulator
VAHFHLTGLDRAALIALLKAQDERLAALADDPAFVAQFERVSEGDPLTCNLLIKALLGNTLSPTDLSRRPPGLEAFLRDWVETLRRMRQESAAIRELLALCLATRARLLMRYVAMRLPASSSPSASTATSSATNACAKSSSNRFTRPQSVNGCTGGW